MKKLSFFIAMLLFLSSALFSQVSINADNSAPDNSAMLDVKSTTKGMLVPRMTISQRNAIASPAKGLLVFCTDNNQYYSNTGTPASPGWVMVMSQWLTSGSNIYYNGGNVGIGWSEPHAPLQLSNILGNRKIVLYELANDDHQYYGFGINDNTLRYQVNTTGDRHAFFAGSGSSSSVELMRIQGNGTVGIGTTTPSTSSVLDLGSVNKGFLPPRMTKTQRDAISTPATGLMIYNTTSKSVNVFNGTTWTFPDGSTADVPDGQPCPGQPEIFHDGKLYHTVQIGSQCWFRENLNIGTRIDGGVIQTDNGIIEKYCYDNLESNCDIYGGLYRWGEMMQYVTTEGTQGICPAGWHIPPLAELTILITYLGGESVAGGKMKETGTTHWLDPNTSATNSSGFTALPGGSLYSDFHLLKEHASFFTSSSFDVMPCGFIILYYNGEVQIWACPPSPLLGYSIRCIRN
jgi:uncharacterized protein (TIGR02145 family)